MDKREELRKKMAERRKAKAAGGGAAGGGAPEAAGEKPAAGTRRRLGAGAGAGKGAPRRSSAGARLQATAKPPSKTGKFVRILLILISFVGVPALIIGSFFVPVGVFNKNVKDPDEKVAFRFWRLLTSSGAAKKDEELERPEHPNMIAFRAAAADINKYQKELARVRKELQERDATQAWEEEKALSLRTRLDETREAMVPLLENLSKLADWLKAYNDAKGRAGDLYDKFGHEKRKKECVKKGIALGEVPGDYAEEMKDPDLVTYIQICRDELELHKYLEAHIPDQAFQDAQRDASSMMKGLRGLSAQVPSKEAIAKGELGASAPPKPETPAPPKPDTPAPAAPAIDVRTVHRWHGARPGMWVRFKRTVGGQDSYEDRVVESADDDSVTFLVQSVVAGNVTDPASQSENFADGEVKALPDEAVEVGGTSVPCHVVQVGTRTLWIPKEGPGAGKVLLKEKDGDAVKTVTEIGLAPLEIKGESKECLYAVRGGDKYWYHDGVPGRLVKIEALFGATELVDFGTDAASRPEMPGVAKEIPLPVRPHPWAVFKPGGWVRKKSTEKRGDEPATEVVFDEVLAEISGETVTLQVETRKGDAVEESRRDVPVARPGAKALAEETLLLDGKEYACVVVEDGTGKEWVPKDGRAATLTVLKREDGNGASRATAVAEERVRVGERELECLKVTREVERGGQVLQVEEWFAEEVPGFVVRRKMAGQEGGAAFTRTVEVVAFGDEAGARPALIAKAPDPPPPPPEPPKPKEPTPAEIVQKADQDVIKAQGLFVPVFQAISAGLPDDPEQLNALLKKNGEAISLLVGAREAYSGVQEKAPNPSEVADSLKKLETVLGILQNYEKEIKSKLE